MASHSVHKSSTHLADTEFLRTIGLRLGVELGIELGMGLEVGLV